MVFSQTEQNFTVKFDSGSGGGQDGFSPIVDVATIDGGHRVTITDKQGTESFDVMDGETPEKGVDYFDGQPGIDGQDGAPGKDGTSVTVQSVIESTEDGGSNVVTFSDGKTVTVKNGGKGSTGAAGKDGADGKDGSDANVTKANVVAALGYSPVDSANISLGIASDGLIYIFVDGSPVGTGIPQGQGGDVFGYVDENNNIILNGNLAEGTYTIKYEMEDGSLINIGSLELDNNVYYTVTNNLTNCTNSNTTNSIVKDGSYTATITAKDGYELKSVVVTMSGSPVSVSGGNISIASVTGNIVITAVAEEAAKEPTNFIVYNATNTTDWSIYCTNARVGSDGTYRSSTTQDATNYIAVQNGDEVHWHNMNINSQAIGMYNSGKAKVSAGNTVGLKTNGHIADVTTLDSGTHDGQFTITNASVAYIRFTVNRSSYPNLPPSGYTVNIKRNGEWL